MAVIMTARVPPRGCRAHHYAVRGGLSTPPAPFLPLRLLLPPPTSLRMPAVRTYEPPDALAAMVRLPSAELASNGLGLLFAIARPLQMITEGTNPAPLP